MPVVRRAVYWRPMDMNLTDYPATLTLLLLNIGVSVLAFSNRNVFDYLALAPYEMRARREYHQIVTSAFIHANVQHLLVNMLSLYFMGTGLEMISVALTGGRGAYLIIYAVSMVAGSLYPFYKYRNAPNYRAVGASGAVSGVVFAFCLFDPMAELRVMFAIPMPAIVFAGLYTAYSIYAMRNIDDNIGHEAHLAGALGGVIATFIAAPSIVWFLR